MAIRIGSFNIKDFGQSSLGKKDMDTIASIIRNYHYDVVAIQEISDKYAMMVLLEAVSGQRVENLMDAYQRTNGYDDAGYYKNEDLGSFNINSRVNDSFGFRASARAGRWEGRWAKPVSKSNASAEGYAFIWNRERIRLTRNNDGEEFEPRIADNKEVDRLARPPFIGRFTPVNSSYEIRLIDTHIAFQKSKNDDTNLSDINIRIQELSILTQWVFKKFDNMVFDYSGHDRNARYMPWYTFLLGDYNLNLGHGESQSARIPDSLRDQEIVIARGKRMRLMTFNEGLTTLKKRPSDIERLKVWMASDAPEIHLANNFDHFTIDVNKFLDQDVAVPAHGVMPAYQCFNNNGDDTKYDIYRDRVSDHLPIYMDIDLRKRA